MARRIRLVKGMDMQGQEKGETFRCAGCGRDLTAQPSVGVELDPASSERTVVWAEESAR